MNTQPTNNGRYINTVSDFFSNTNSKDMRAAIFDLYATTIEPNPQLGTINQLHASNLFWHARTLMDFIQKLEDEHEIYKKISDFRFTKTSLN